MHSLRRWLILMAVLLIAGPVVAVAAEPQASSAASPAANAAATAVTVTLHAEGVVTSDRVLLRDIAAISGSAAEIEALGGFLVRRLPDLGSFRVTADEIQALLRRQRPQQSIAVSGETAVRRAADHYSADELNKAALAHLQGRADDRQITATVRRDASPLTVPADAGHPTTVEAEPLTDAWWGDVPYRLRILRAGQELARTLVVLQVSAWREIPVAARSLDRGTALSLQDVVMSRVEVRPGAGNDQRTVEDVLGWVTTRHVPAGTAIGNGFARPLPAVRAGTVVLLVYDGGGFTLTVHAEAMIDGAIGDRVRVRTDQGRTVTALVTAANEVRISQPQAETTQP